MTRKNAIKQIIRLKAYFQYQLQADDINAMDVAIDALKEQSVAMSVIDQIKADIELARYGLVNDGLDLALKIIDKHIKQ